MKKQITLIGCGRWGINILRDLMDLGCHVTVIDPSQTAQERASQMGAIVYSDLNSHNINTDAYIIAANCKQHYPLLLKLKDKTQPIYIEKPMVLTIREAEHIQSLMGARVFVMHKWRYHPGIIALKQLIQNKKLGNIKKVSTVRHGLSVDYDIPGHLILLPHDLSIILELMGEIPPIENIIPYFAKGELQGFKLDFCSAPAVSIDICSRNKELKREIKLTFSEGSALLTEKNYFQINLFDRSGKLQENIELKKNQPLKTELQAFLNYLTYGEILKSNIQDELQIANCTHEIVHRLGVMENTIKDKCEYGHNT